MISVFTYWYTAYWHIGEFRQDEIEHVRSWVLRKSEPVRVPEYFHAIGKKIRKKCSLMNQPGITVFVSIRFPMTPG